MRWHFYLKQKENSMKRIGVVGIVITGDRAVAVEMHTSVA